MRASNLTQQEVDGLFGGASIDHTNLETHLSAANTLVDGVPLAEYIDQRIRALVPAARSASAASIGGKTDLQRQAIADHFVRRITASMETLSSRRDNP